MNSSSETNAIEASNLEKTYKLGMFAGTRVKALRGVSLTVKPGEVFGIIGPNGAGKSTTIKILLNLVRATGGQAKIFGIDVSERAARAGLGFVPENPAPYEYLSGREFVEMGAKLAGISGKDIRARAASALDRVGMSRACDLRIRRYSKGMTQRTVLASALVAEPKILILDEPTSGLDPVGRRLVRDVIFDERKKGTTIVFCTHIIADVESVCDRLSVFVEGKCVKEGTVAELLSGQAPRVEAMVDNVDAAKVRELAQSETLNQIGSRCLVTLSEDQLPTFIPGILQHQGKVLRIVPVRFSLEDVFLETLKTSSTNMVGSLIE
jgi:ABC-2 type transport system ATP-binding protein